MAKKLPKNPNIARKVREGIKGGVSVQTNL